MLDQNLRLFGALKICLKIQDFLKPCNKLVTEIQNLSGAIVPITLYKHAHISEMFHRDVTIPNWHVLCLSITLMEMNVSYIKFLLFLCQTMQKESWQLPYSTDSFSTYGLSRKRNVTSAHIWSHLQYLSWGRQ